MKEEKSQIEKQIDLHAAEGDPSPTGFRWVGPGVAEWSRVWIRVMRIKIDAL